MEPVGTPRAAFFTAVERGDARAIAGFFTQRVSRHISATIDVVGDAHERRAGHEWLRPFDPRTDRYAEPGTLIATAITSDYVDVLAWLFSQEAIAAIAPEPLITAIQSACQLAMSVNALAVLELLLTSRVFTQLLSDEPQQMLLDRLLKCVASKSTPDIIRLLTAHGASVNKQLGDDRESIVLRQVALQDNRALMDAVIRHGEYTAGVAVFDEAFARPYEAIQPLLAMGARPIHAARVLHRTVWLGKISNVKIWLEHGFIDVDARDATGQTPLMHAHKLSMSHGRRVDWDGAAAAATLLLAFGASVAAKDSHDETPLRHVINSRASDVLRLLLEHGADANQPTNGDHVVLDFLDLIRLSERGPIADQLELLLQFGAKPYLLGKHGLSAVDRLQMSTPGRAFITAHPQWFASTTT